MSVRSLRAALGRSPVVVASVAAAAALTFSACGDDVVDDGVEQEVEEGGEEVEEEVDEETTDG
jgi:hypothetical protein